MCICLLQILNTSDMSKSLQVCNCCGWSKVTTYQGLRVHQGKKGCTEKGMRIPEFDQFRMSSYLPKITYMGRPIAVEEPLMNIFNPGEWYTTEIRAVFITGVSIHLMHTVKCTVRNKRSAALQ